MDVLSFWYNVFLSILDLSDLGNSGSLKRNQARIIV